MNAAVRTASGTYLVDLETEEVIGETDDFDSTTVKVELPRVVAAASAGATVVAVVDRRPPIAGPPASSDHVRRPTGGRGGGC